MPVESEQKERWYTIASNTDTGGIVFTQALQDSFPGLPLEYRFMFVFSGLAFRSPPDSEHVVYSDEMFAPPCSPRWWVCPWPQGRSL